jgi:hypothetical protein
MRVEWVMNYHLCLFKNDLRSLRPYSIKMVHGMSMALIEIMTSLRDEEIK